MVSGTGNQSTDNVFMGEVKFALKWDSSCFLYTLKLVESKRLT